MFVGAHQQDWRFHITARYLGGTRRVLPLSRQSERSLFQRHIVDFRDEKFYLHLYSNELEQKRYASFLCEKFSEFEGREIVSVSFERLHQKFLPIHEAFRVGHHLEEQTRTWVLNDFQCSQKGLSRLG